ncbi:MAG TPA: cytochrome b/b6 domain-containing protein [Steroidobacteraceae bacterium]
MIEKLRSEQSVDSRLDEALEMTFPASDPIAVRSSHEEAVPYATPVPIPNEPATAPSEAAANSGPSSYSYARHPLPVRIMHWVNVLAVTVLLMSGLQIFNAHSALYWGQSSYSGRPPLLLITTRQSSDGHPIGVTRVLGHEFTTTGLLGISSEDGRPTARAFPAWATIPGPQWLAMGRLWHFFFAWVFFVNGALYVAYSVVTRHLSRDLLPTREDWRSIGHSILDHLRFRHPSGDAARHYNVLQKLTYLLVMLGLLPLILLMGLGMSPRLDSLWPGWVGIFGGRQAMRTLHFVIAWAIVLFVLVHVFEVIISGFWNNLRSMITGRYEVRTTHENPK